MAHRKVIIAIDAMGGDFSPQAVIDGAALALNHEIGFNPKANLEFLIFGDIKTVKPLIEKHETLKKFSHFTHSELKILPEDRPSYAVRNYKNTSMGMAVAAVKDHLAHAVVSSGNTGALMAIAKTCLKTLPGIDRPAIVGLFPTIKSKVVMLDIGANAICDSNNLVEFAIMGDAFAKVMLGKTSPKVAILNIGSEDIKGHETVRCAAQELQGKKALNFTGYIEADDIVRGNADVIVTDGFSGNIAIKMAEGTAYLARNLLDQTFKTNLLSRIGYLFTRKPLKQAFQKIDGRHYNGAMFIGLNGVVVKSHGGADSIAFSNAVTCAIKLSRENINNKIINEISIVQQNLGVS